MKKVFFLFAAFLISTCAWSQTTDTKMDKMQDGKMMNHKMQDGIMMKDNKMMVMKNGKTMLMDKDMKMSNGTMVMMDGTVKMKDGKTMMMKNGDHMSMNGKMGKMKMDRKQDNMDKNEDK